jgi:uncharacterized protein YciI
MAVFIMATLVLGALAQQKERRPPPGLRCPERTLVLFDVDWNAFKKDMFNEHSAYLLKQMKAGKIVSAGALDIALTPPASNKVPNGAAVIYTSTNWSEVEETIKQDPYYRAGVATVAIHKVWTACEPEK